jgi:hypothetical protein
MRKMIVDIYKNKDIDIFVIKFEGKAISKKKIKKIGKKLSRVLDTSFECIEGIDDVEVNYKDNN